MFLTPALFQTQERDLTRLVPIYAQPVAFNAIPGEHIRFASFVPEPKDLSAFIAQGISLFVSETGRFGPPDSGAGPYDLNSLLAQRAAIKAAGGDYGLSIFTTFPGTNEAAINALTGEKTPAWSLWNQERIRWSANKYGPINRKFAKLGLVNLGVYGEYGDASLFTGLVKSDPQQSQAWTAKFKSEPPTPGLWSGDDSAKASWKRKLVAQYESIEGAYKIWGMAPEDATKLPIPIDAGFPYTARLEYMDWYRSAIPSLVGSLSDIGRAIFTSSPILIPIGPPNDSPYLGLDIFRVAEAVLGKADALNVTNVGYYSFADNWAMSLARIRGAANAAGLSLWTQAPTPSPAEFDERLFETVSLGAHGHIDWPQAYQANNELDAPLFAEPKCDVAILHPTSSHVLNLSQSAPPLTYRGCVELRDYADLDELEESAVISGALKNYRVAAVFEGTVWDSKTLSAIKEWVQSGGVLTAYDFGKMADPQGNNSIYQELFGFASQLTPAKSTDHWVGEIPNSYQIDLGSSSDSEFLVGQWGQPTAGSRPASNGAALRLPVSKGSSIAITVLFGAAATGIKQIEFSSQGKLLAGASLEGGLKQFKFAVEKSQTADGILEIAIGGLEPGATVPIDSISVSIAEEETQIAPLEGRFEAPVDIDLIKSWSKPYGKGRLIFFPGKRDQWKQYISVINAAIYKLSQIDPAKTDARQADAKKDGVFVTDLGDRIAAFNDNSKEVTRNYFGKDIVIPAHSLRIASSAPPPFISIYQFEFSPLEEFPIVEAPEASPGKGITALRVSPGQTLKAAIIIPTDGRYKLFARTLRNGALSPVKFKVNDIDSSPANKGLGDTYLVGEFDLLAGSAAIQLSSDSAFLADLLLVTGSSASGFRFPLKRQPNP